MKPNRTQKQEDANRIDHDLYALALKFSGFANKHNDEAADQVSRKLFAMRPAIRKHMHRGDAEEARG